MANIKSHDITKFWMGFQCLNEFINNLPPDHPFRVCNNSEEILNKYLDAHQLLVANMKCANRIIGDSQDNTSKTLEEFSEMFLDYVDFLKSQ